MSRKKKAKIVISKEHIDMVQPLYDVTTTILCRRSLYFFMQEFWDEVSNDTFKSNWHLKLFCNELQTIAERVSQNKPKEYDLIVNVPPGTTKPVWEEMDVLFSNGEYKPLKDVKKGDSIINMMGAPCFVEDVHEQGLQPCVKIDTMGGRTLYVANDHPILTTRGWVNGEDIQRDDVLALMHTPQIVGTSKRGLDEFRLAGYLIGDGSVSSNNCSICGIDQDYLNDLIACLNRLSFGYHKFIDKNGVTVVQLKKKSKEGISPRQWIRDIGIAGKTSKTKNIPAFVWKGTDEQVIAFLSAYFHCDGCISYRDKGKRNILISMTTISKELAIGLQRLFLRLGIAMKLRVRMQKKGFAYNRGLTNYKYYQVESTDQDTASRFLERMDIKGYKFEKLKGFSPQKKTFEQEFWPDIVKEVNQCGLLPCRCLTVSAGHSFIIDGVVVHNTTTFMIMFPVWCWINWFWMRFITASYSSALSLESAEYSRDLIRSSKFKRLFPELTIKQDKDTKSNFKIIKTSQGKIELGGNRYSTSVGGTLTGFHGHILLVDDPLDPNRAASTIELANANRWIDQTLSTRKIDKSITPTIMIMQRLHECLHPNTRIWTQNGFTEVINIKRWEKVLTSGGWQNVLAINNRPYKGKIIGLKVSGHPEIPWLTANHRVYTAKGWINAGDLTKRDVLLFPLPNKKKKTAVEIKKLWPALPYKEKTPKTIKQTFNGNEKRVPYIELKKLVDGGWTSKQMADYFGFATRQMIDLYIAKYKIVRKNALTVKSDLLLDPDFWRLVGYWVAEGSLVRGRRKINNSVRFSFGNKDGKLIVDAVNILKKYGFNPTITDNKNNSFTLFCVSYQLALFFEMFGIGAKNKKIPEWMLSLPIEYIQQFIKGYWLGDGCIARNYARFTSISVELLTGIQRLLLQIGIVSSIYKGKIPIEPCIIKTGPGKGRRIKGKHNPYELRVARKDIDAKLWKIGLADIAYTKKTVNKIKDGYLYVKILDILEKDYIGAVYDITTPTHDFLVGLTMLHNSDPSGHLLAKQKANLKHISLPGEIRNYRKSLKPDSLAKNYVDDLLDPKRMSWDVLKDMEADLGQYGYSSQIGQSPTSPEGGMFKVAMLSVVENLPSPTNLTGMVRAWDKAGTFGGGAYTVGLKLYRYSSGRYIVVDVVRGQWSSEERENIIRTTAEADGRDVSIVIEQEPGSGGKESAEATIRNLAGFNCLAERPTGDKAFRADPVSVQVNNGNVSMLRGDWNFTFTEELRNFPFSTYKDQTDAFSMAFHFLTKKKRAGMLFNR